MNIVLTCSILNVDYYCDRSKAQDPDRHTALQMAGSMDLYVDGTVNKQKMIRIRKYSLDHAY